MMSSVMQNQVIQKQMQQSKSYLLQRHMGHYAGQYRTDESQLFFTFLALTILTIDAPLVV